MASLFHRALVDPKTLSMADFELLLSKYPYAQPLHFAFARKKFLEDEGHPLSDKAILFASSPYWLQNYVQKPIATIPSVEVVDDDYVPFEEFAEDQIELEDAVVISEEADGHNETVAEEEGLETAFLASDREESVDEEENTLETLVMEGIGGGDYFALHATQPTIQEEEKTEEKEAENISLYNDELMPYSFRWWLHKTRLEHAETYQPFVNPVLPVASNGQFDRAKLDEIILDQQIREHIIHLQDPEDKLSEEVKKNEVKLTDTNKTAEVIEKFIREEPQIQPPPADQLTMENKARKSSEEHFDLVTETLASIYADQGMYVKAIEVYKKLILRFPEKKSYFATQIKNLEEKLY